MSEQSVTDQHVASTPDVRDIVKQVIEEFVRTEQRQAEPAYKAELHDERKRRDFFVRHLLHTEPPTWSELAKATSGSISAK